MVSSKMTKKIDPLAVCLFVLILTETTLPTHNNTFSIFQTSNDKSASVSCSQSYQMMEWILVARWDGITEAEAFKNVEKIMVAHHVIVSVPSEYVLPPPNLKKIGQYARKCC